VGDNYKGGVKAEGSFGFRAKTVVPRRLIRGPPGDQSGKKRGGWEKHEGG